MYLLGFYGLFYAISIPHHRGHVTPKSFIIRVTSEAMKCSNVQYSIALCRSGRSHIFLYNVQSSILFPFALLPSFFLRLLYPEFFINALIRTNWEGLWNCLLNDLLMDFNAICGGEKLGLGVFNFCRHAAISDRSLVPYVHSRS